ncbi:Chitotriosidase-1 [Morella rubra]|uniref:Chitotriosidase-1 n=1 Tax=Morella rubra TaxID=262757 RepID=A0A6A1VGH1_9ROSI|nr:Chitotriosidase-1 [Morella rubra]
MTTDLVKAGYWSSISGFAVANIDSSNFTYLFCAFAELDPKTYEVTFPTATKHEFQTFTETVQRKNPDVKTLLSIGGPTANTATFVAMASQESNLASFITSSIALARTNNFYGLDLSWLYPSTEDESGYSGNDPLLLTAQVFSSPHSVRAICRNLDWINVLPYNLHSPDNFPNQIGANAPSRSTEKNPSWEAGINAWIEAGVDNQKVVLGLAFVGYAWLPVNGNKKKVTAPAKGAPPSYPTAPSTNFDDRKSISKKIAYAKEKNLLGYFAWHVGTKDIWMLSETGPGYVSSQQAEPAQGTQQSQTSTQPAGVHQPQYHSQGSTECEENSSRGQDTHRPAWLASFISNLEVVFRARLAPIEARLDMTEELMKNMRQDQAQISATLQRVEDKQESMSQAQARLKDRTKGMGQALARIEDSMQDMSSIPTQLDTVNEGLDKLSMSVADISEAMPKYCQGDEDEDSDGSPRGRCGWD